MATTQANAILQNVSQYTPEGAREWRTNGSKEVYDANTGHTYEVPLWQEHVTLSEPNQRLWDLGKTADIRLAEIGLDQTNKIGTLLGTNINFDSLTPYGNPGELYYPEYEGYSQGNETLGRAMDAAGAGIRGGIQGAGMGIQRSLDYSKNPSYATGVQSSGQRQTSLGQGQFGMVGEIGDAGQITKSYGGDYEESRRRVEEAIMSRARPELDRIRQAQQSRAANQGIDLGSRAYSEQERILGQNENDAIMGSILAGGQEQTRLDTMERQRAQFQNAAQQQEFLQQAARAGFINQAQAQDFAQILARGQFANQGMDSQFAERLASAGIQNQGAAAMDARTLNAGQFANAAQAQGFGQRATAADFTNRAQAQRFGQLFSAGQQQLDNDFRYRGAMNQLQDNRFNQHLTRFNAQNSLADTERQNLLTLRNQPINEIAALLGGTQIQTPQFNTVQMPQLANIDYMGFVGDTYKTQSELAAAQAAAQAQMVSAGIEAAGSMAGGMMASDRRVKRDVSRVGTVRGLGLYVYRYIWDDLWRVGVMAQEVLRSKPEMVANIGGVLHVDYGRL